MRDFFEVLFGAGSGFGFYQLFSNPSHKIFLDKTSPKLAKNLRRVKRGLYQKFVRDIKVHNKVEILPSMRLNIKNRQVHLHHWIPLSVVLGVLLYKSNDITSWTLIKSFIAGGAVHGFMYKDRFKIFKKNEEPDQSFNSTSATKGK